MLRNQQRFLEKSEAICQAFDPASVLRRGYSLTLKNGKAVTSAKDVEAGDLLETHLREGVVRSEVQ